MTAAVLAAFLGQERAAQVMAARRKPSPGTGMMIFRTLAIGTPLALVAMIVLGVMKAAKTDNETATDPGYSAFQNANSTISGLLRGGNNAEATAACEALIPTARVRAIKVRLFKL